MKLDWRFVLEARLRRAAPETVFRGIARRAEDLTRDVRPYGQREGLPRPGPFPVILTGVSGGGLAWEGPAMAVMAPNGPYKIQKTPPSASLQGLPSPPAPEIVPRWPATALLLE